MNRIEAATFLVFCALFGGMLFLQCSPATEQKTLQGLDELCAARASSKPHLDAGADAAP